MEQVTTINFKKPSFAKRITSMLGVDFYRLFHTPMLYIFLAMAAIIPAMVLSMTGTPDANGEVIRMYNNTWNIIAADTPLYIIRNIGDYTNMNMVYIFGGIMVSIFIGHDYNSGYVKQLFTTHSLKRDYMMSKSITGAFSMMCMCVTYLFGSVLAGIITGADMKVNAGSLILALLGKMIMSLGWASLYTMLNVIFRHYFGISITSCFVLGTGIPIIGAAALIGNNSMLNIFLYGSSVNACLNSNMVTLLTCLAISFMWAIIYNFMGTVILSRSDVY